MKKLNWKALLPHIAIGLVFIAASAIYFWPAVEGQVIYAGDNINGLAAVQESKAFHDNTGEYTYWTNSMFSGMPNYQIGGNGGYLVDKIMKPIKWFLSWGNRNVFFIFLFYLCAFFCLLRAFKVNKWLSLAGAFAIALSSYFFVIIGASHNGKCYSITWMTLVIVGFILTYQKQYGWGAVLVMFFTYIGFFLHPQMSYYLCMLIGILFFAELAIVCQSKEWKHFVIATGLFAASFLVGMGMGSAHVFTNMEYSAETMRGGHSDLVKETDSENKTAGLDLDYATAWSYGINETMTLLIPNFMGGASGYNVGEESLLYEELVRAGVPRNSAKQFCQSAPTYWGEKAFTSGAVYVGAIIFFLFIFALIVVKGPYKWALLVATLLSICLAWGHNFMPLTELFFHYFPMYNKFRAVESILIVAEITIPLLAFLGVQQIIIQRKDSKATSRNRQALYIAAGITAGICLLFVLFGKSFISFTSSYDTQWKGQVGERIYQMIIEQRADMMIADAWRSFIFILLAFALLWFYLQKEFKTAYVGIALAMLVVADMWPVCKRFCNNSQFVTPKNRDKAFVMQPYEKWLLDNDKTYYRVLNLTTNAFNDARTSYYLKSIGGYHAAKLSRYQDLIDQHISKMNMNVLNMLNAKYIITRGQNGNPIPQLNPEALGNAWFVDSLLIVDNANAESDALRTIDIHTTAVLDKAFADFATILHTPHDSTAHIALTSYAPNRLKYTYSTQTPKTAVFSEIYYPHGWKATIDGEPIEHFRVNYMLRALNVPAGQHEIEFTFEPDSVRKGNIISLICLFVFFLTLTGVVGYKIYGKRKKEKANG